MSDVVFQNIYFEYQPTVKYVINKTQILNELKDHKYYDTKSGHLFQQIFVEFFLHFYVYHIYYVSDNDNSTVENKELDENIAEIFKFIIKHTKDLQCSILPCIQYDALLWTQTKKNIYDKHRTELIESKLIREISFRNRMKFLEFAHRIDTTNPVFNNSDLVRQIVTFI